MRVCVYNKSAGASGKSHLHNRMDDCCVNNCATALQQCWQAEVSAALREGECAFPLSLSLFVLKILIFVVASDIPQNISVVPTTRVPKSVAL